MPEPTTALRNAVLLGLGLGLASAGCFKDDDDDDADDSAEASDTDGGDADADTDGGDTDADTDGGSDTDGGTQTLDPVPDGDYPECGPDDTGGFVGPCCVDVYCIDSGSDGACRTADDVTAEELTGLSLGSGDCQCSPVEGPYAPRAEDSGACCYLVGVQGCTGRPVVIRGRPIRARARWGRAWAQA